MATIDRVSALTLVTIDAAARAEARSRGYQANQIIHLEHSIAAYEHRIDAAALTVPGRLRGLSGPAGGRHRAIWVAPAPEPLFLESLCHEIAHAVLPLRTGHTTDWLAVTVEALAEVSSPAHCRETYSQASRQYQIAADAGSGLARS